MNLKIRRISLLIPIIAISIFLGSAVLMKVNSSTLQSTIDSNCEETSLDIPPDYSIYEILSTEGCYCIATGGTYSDETPPVIDIKSPPNNSKILVNTTIFIEITDDFPAMEGGPSFVPEVVKYHWNDATSNITVYDAYIDDPPAPEEPVRVELTLPSDEANATHVLYVYAVDYEGNWASITFVYTTPDLEEESSSWIPTWTTTIPTTTTEHRRTDGFLVMPIILILIGLVNVITWRRRRRAEI